MDSSLSTAHALLGALAITVVLAGLHLAAPRIRRLPLVPEAATGSFAGGLAVAYVFLHLLPEIAEGNEAVGAALTDVLEPTPLIDLGIFLVALAGFTAFFAMERLADRRVGARTGDRAVNPAGAAAGRPPAGVYWLHLGSFVVYNALITYTMPLRLRTGVLFALLFTVAMGLHFVLTDRGLEERYGARFDRTGRLILTGGLLLGWAAAALAAPTSTLLVALLTALLGGSILLNVFKEEIPSGRRTSFGWFLTGLALYAGLLAAVTAVSE
ncbi:hypothetical protein [Pseudosporangium ferrugineum]|uniref:ZIP family zinc transporter n=1 Tax=Pseudosporangium ferrugineum TaxID=439699 RepID=A0A2T0RG02_9ACTN|nr:hypothetical protein [Pseudosporangium ferrugineum]PRY20134.1 hypothetical protein CLV70_12515 [Pseudosporangium ferrugineum]